MHYHMLSAFTWPTQRWNELLQTANYPNGHSVLGGYMALRPKDPDSIAYERALAAKVGEERMNEILSVNIHHVIYYPCLSVQSPLQQLRCLRPVSPRRLSEIWHFRSRARPRRSTRSLWYYISSTRPPPVNADDGGWNRVQRGLQAEEMEWCRFTLRRDMMDGEVIRTRRPERSAASQSVPRVEA
jgi:hypothetical protein